MSATPRTARYLSDLPVWRLIVALADAERTCGPDSSTVRALARALRARLRQQASRRSEDLDDAD
jgi:hypothetical protein